MKIVFSVLPLSSTLAATRKASARVKPESITSASLLPLTTTAFTWKLLASALYTFTASGAGVCAPALPAAAMPSDRAGTNRRRSLKAIVMAGSLVGFAVEVRHCICDDQVDKQQSNRILVAWIV